MSSNRLWILLFVIGFCSILQAKEVPPFVEDGLKRYSSQVFFEENLGQYESDIHFQTFVPEHLVRFTSQGLSIAWVREAEVRDQSREPESEKHQNYQWSYERQPEYEGLVWNVQFVNAQNQSKPIGKGRKHGYLNYLIGSDASQWTTGVRRYQELWYEDIYTGIDLRYYGTAQHQLKYDFILQPEANIQDIQMKWEGIEGMSLDNKGNLHVETYWGEKVDLAPYAYQMINGKEVEVSVEYQQLLAGTIGFEIKGEYQPEYPLIIDPLTLAWSSFFHASTSDDYVMSVCRDDMNFVYFTGYTKVLNFPITTGVFQNTYAGGIDAYVTKMAADGTSMIYSTYMGGSDWEIAYGIGVNSSYEPYIAGFCRSSNFPVTAGSVQPTSNGGLVESFVAKLSADGTSLLYGTYLGGTDRDYLYDLVVRPTGEAYVAGYTLSSDFPTTTGGYSGGPKGNGDVFVAKLNASGSTMQYGTLFGGTNYDIANGLAVDADGEAFIVGNTGSTDFPVSSGVVQSTPNFGGGLNQEDAFIVKLNAAGSAVEYSTYLGGSAGDAAYSVDINPAEEAFLTGITYSTNFPTTAGVLLPTTASPSGLGDGFVVKLNATASSLSYSTYIGGSNLDYGKAIRVDPATDMAYVLGATQSGNFPVTSGATPYASQFDVFMSVLTANGASLEHGNLYGGSYNDYPRAASSLYVDNSKITLGITTHSGDVPMTTGSYQGTKMNGVSDAPWLVGIELDAVLNVSLDDFSASWNRAEEGVDVGWKVQGEEAANSTFVLERKSALEGWQEIHRFSWADQAFDNWQDQEARLYTGQSLQYRLRFESENGDWGSSHVEEVKIPIATRPHLVFTPNPAKDHLKITCSIPPMSQARIRILDLAGRTYFSQPIQEAGNIGRIAPIVVSVEDWPSGVYLIHVSGSTGPEISEKLIIAH